MASIEQIKGSDGSDNASLATIQNARSPGTSTIIVDTVLAINPSGFAGSMGTPHTFTDPITSETITVISEATVVDFTGHVDGSNLEIDAIAPGYVDNGSEVGDIVIIRPTTQYADNVADVLEVSHNNDGSLKNNVVTTNILDDNSVTSAKIVNGAIVFGDLLSTIFSGQILTYTPTLTVLTAGLSYTANTHYYLNLGGIKLCWGSVSYSSSGPTSGRATVSLPPSNFFTTVQIYQPAISSEGNYAFQVVSGDSIVGTPPATYGWYVSNTGNPGSGRIDVWIVGT